MGRTTVIIGGGAIGSATAYFLASMQRAQDRVIVIERDPSYQHASSSLSASSIRQQFSTPLSVQLSQFGYEFMAACFQDGRAGGAVGLESRGYLFLADPALEAHLRTRTAKVRAMGGHLAEMNQQQLQAHYPWMQCDDLSYGVIGTRYEGWFDGYRLQQLFRCQARALGVQYLSLEAVGFDLRGGRVLRVQLSDGSSLKADAVVNCAGPWSASIATMAGLEIPVRARRRTVFIVSCPQQFAHFPILIDPSGVFIRPEQEQFLCIVSPPPAQDFDHLPLEPDLGLFESHIWPVLAARVPAFEALRVERAWAGYYEYNTADQNGLVGQMGPENFFLATGFSGHGLQHSAGVGRGMAELLHYGHYKSLDLSLLSPDRIAKQEWIVEEAVY